MLSSASSRSSARVAVDDVERRDLVGQHRAVGPFERELVAERERRERAEMRVAVAGDHGDAVRAGRRAAVEQRRCEREVAPRGSGEHGQRLVAAGQREPRDGMRVGPRPRLRRGVADGRAVPGAIQEMLRELGFGRQPEAGREQRDAERDQRPTASRRSRRCRRSGRRWRPSGQRQHDRHRAVPRSSHDAVLQGCSAAPRASSAAPRRAKRWRRASAAAAPAWPSGGTLPATARRPAWCCRCCAARAPRRPSAPASCRRRRGSCTGSRGDARAPSR